MSRYAKLAAQVVAALIAAVVAALQDDIIDNSEWINVLIVTLGAVGVVIGGETLTGVWRHGKAIVSAAAAGAVLLQSFISDGVTGSEWLQVLLAVLGALGVLAAPGPKVEPLGRHAIKP